MEGSVNELVLDLLKGVPTEEVVNPNVGQFPDAILDDVGVQVNKSGSLTIKMTFSDNGRKRFANFQLAEADSHPLVAKKSLDWQRALGIVESSAKRGYTVRGETPEARFAVAQQIAEAIKVAAQGHNIPYRCAESGDFENFIPIRKP